MTALLVVVAFIGGAVFWDTVLHRLYAELDAAVTLPAPDRIDVRT